MAHVDIHFPDYQLNISVQVGDMLYGTHRSQSGINNPRNPNVPKKLGKIIKVNHGAKFIKIDSPFSKEEINKLGYLFFNKPKAVSVSGILGYYALTEYRNYSKNKAEIFATGTEYAPSSK